MASQRKPAAKRRCTNCQKLRIASQFSAAGARVCTPCKREGALATSRARHLNETYGITVDEYNAILAAQDGKCAGCGGTRRYALHVDHDHKLEARLLAEGATQREAARGSVRGLLCARDNKVLRDIRDNAAGLISLAHYLHNPPARKVLQ